MMRINEWCHMLKIIFPSTLFILACLLTVPSIAAQEAAQGAAQGAEQDAAQGAEQGTEYGGDEYAQGIEWAIGNAGDNADIFYRIYQECPDEWREGAAFLVANMPVVDLAVMDYDTFMNNLRLAYEARETFPYAKAISNEDFLHYVLPYRVSQEPVEDWRPFFYEKAKELAGNARTIGEAVAAIDMWAGTVIAYKPTERRDQGPFETLKSGYGRCEEMMIFYIDAYRAAGIPARQAWTPYWPHCDDNHAWTEYMTEDGEWHFPPAARAALVMSVPFGIPRPEAKVELYRVVAGDNPYAIINSTSAYKPTSELRIELYDENGEPVDKANVFVYVFNYGALRPIAKMETSEEGGCSISIGEGDYLITGGTEGQGAAKVVHAFRDEVMTYELILGNIDIPESFWLKYPLPK